MIKRIVEKAVENGFNLSELFIAKQENEILGWHTTDTQLFINYRFMHITGWSPFSFADLWTNHDFMHAVCGDGEVRVQFSDGGVGKLWAGYLFTIFELSQLPTPEERLNYMERFLDQLKKS